MSHGQAHLVFEWTVLQGQTQPITAALQGVMLATRRQVGCLECSVSTAASDSVMVRYSEVWDTEEHLREHLRSERFRVLARLIEFATEPPRIEFVLPAGTRGIDYATEVCEAP